MNKPLILALALLAATPALAAPARKAAAEKPAAQQPADDANKPFVRVNGNAIPEIDARIAIAERQAAGGENTPALQNAVRNQLIAREVMAQQARKAGLAKNPVVQARTRMAGEEILARAYQEDFARKNPPSDDAVRKEYESLKARSGDKEYRVRHILAAGEDEAKALIGRLKAGERFADLAAQSREERSRAAGGDIGWQSALTLHPSIAEPVARLAKGQYTQEPVRGPAGWHVIQVDDVRPFTLPTLDDRMKAQVKMGLTRRALDAHLAELMKSAKIEP